jgi:hypothetical protein
MEWVAVYWSIRGARGRPRQCLSGFKSENRQVECTRRNGRATIRSASGEAGKRILLSLQGPRGGTASAQRVIRPVGNLRVGLCTLGRKSQGRVQWRRKGPRASRSRESNRQQWTWCKFILPRGRRGSPRLLSSRGRLLPLYHATPSFGPHTKLGFLRSKLLMDTQIAWTGKLQDRSERSEPNAGVWPSAAEDGRRLDAQPGNLHRGEKYRAHGSTSLAVLSAPGRAGACWLAGPDARLPANEMTRAARPGPGPGQGSLHVSQNPSPVAAPLSRIEMGRLDFVHSTSYALVSAAAGTSKKKKERHNLQSPGRCSSSSRNHTAIRSVGAGPHVGGLPQLRGARGWRGSGWSSPRSWLHGEELPALLTLVSFPKRLDSTGLKRKASTWARTMQ